MRHEIDPRQKGKTDIGMENSSRRRRGQSGAIIDEGRRELVEHARRAGLLDQLPAGQRAIVDQRYPSEGAPKSLRNIARGENLTFQRIAQKEAQALGNIERLEEGKEIPKRGRKPREDIDTDEVLRLHLEGKTALEIAGLLKCSPSTIGRRLEPTGVGTRRRGRPRISVDLSLAPHYYFAKGHSLQKIADAFGVNHKTIGSRLREEGHVLRPPKR